MKLGRGRVGTRMSVGQGAYFADTFDTALSGWTGGTPTLAGGNLSLTPTRGEQLLLNPGNPFAFTADNPTSWTVTGESGGNEISQVGQGLGHGGGGTGYCNIYTTTASIYMFQSKTTAGLWYEAEVDVDTITAGSIYVATAGTSIKRLQTTGTHIVSFNALDNTIRIYRYSGATDVTISNTGLWTLSNFIRTRQHDYAQAVVTLSGLSIGTAKAAGIVLNFDGTNNYVLAYIQGTTAYLAKVLNGVLTPVTSGSISGISGSTFQAQRSLDDKYIVKFGAADSLIEVINSAAITDSVFSTSKKFGVFSSHEDNLIGGYAYRKSTGREATGIESDSANIYVMADVHVEEVTDYYYDAAWVLGNTKLTSLVTAINAAPLDAVLSLGDFANDNSRVIDAASRVSTLDNLYSSVGNHECVDQTLTPTQAKAGTVTAYGMPSNYYAFDCPGKSWLRIIVLDSCFSSTDDSDIGQQLGHLSAAEMTWFSNQIDSSSAYSAVLVMVHHGPIANMPTGTPRFDSAQIPTLSNILNSRSNVFVLNGHWHWDNGVKYWLGYTECHEIPALCISGKYGVVTVTKYTTGRCGISVTLQAV